MRKIFFISDAHIGAGDIQQENLKLDKLKKFADIAIAEGETLFILGDFFDFWFEYKRTVFIRNFDALCILKKIADAGVQMHFFGGNHDWWMKKKGFFHNELNAKVYRKPATIEIRGKKFFLAHSDGIAPSDWGYRNILKPILRNPLSVWLFRLLPSAIAWRLANFVSSGSRLYTKKRNLRFEKECEEFAQKKIQEGFDFVILAHTHFAVVHQFDNGIYMNIGEFFEQFNYAEFDGNNLILKRIE